ncbi:TIR domain-containing protein [Actinophytocola sp.]|uniref:TIR domain-containing protein n=1 Tax=Actinophytocola sp. TaxID=1872138 RepID=UPI002D400DAB|nr:TIR domain-containing protein [Actinophytocola sp.]HYQ64757.1 TIR domain-containing protein [Actinophytocola sp.]
MVISKAFVNFRVGDGQDAAVLIDNALRKEFGEDHVFRSSRSMPAGTVFQSMLLTEAAGCAVMIVVIGDRWLDENNGVRRIDDPGDWVRTEISLALANDRPVIPVLLGDRPNLGAKDRLPAPIAGLVDRQYVRLRHQTAERDLAHLVDEVRPLVTTQGMRIAGPGHPLLLTNLAPTQRSSDLRLGPAEIDGRYFGESIVYRPSLFSAQPRASISFNLGRKYGRLEVTVGVLDDAAEADQVGVFRIVTDGKVSTQVAASQGQPQLLSVEVTDVLNLRLEAYRPGTTAHPLQAGANMAGGVSNKLPELAWGDPMLYP